MTLLIVRSARLRRQRDRLHLSQEKVAQQANISTRQYQRIEQGQSTLIHWRVVVGIAIALHTTINHIAEFQQLKYKVT